MFCDDTSSDDGQSAGPTPLEILRKQNTNFEHNEASCTLTSQFRPDKKFRSSHLNFFWNGLDGYEGRTRDAHCSRGALIF
jgi:hypothetical protein